MEKQVINIKEKTVEELKAIAYDMLLEINRLNRDLQTVEKEIELRATTPVPVKKSK